MNSLTLSFNEVNFSPIQQSGQIWLKATELSDALGYSRSDKVTRLYDRNSDEFDHNMTQVIDISQNPNSGVSNLVSTVRIFSLRGCHLIAMFARTTVAKQFRKWVLDVWIST